MLKYLASIFDSAQSTSFSRFATALTVLVGCVCVIHTTFHSHALPDASSLLGLGGFMTAPYAINKFTGALPGRGDGTVAKISAAADELTPADDELTPAEARAMLRSHLRLERFCMFALLVWGAVVLTVKLFH